MDDKLYEIFSEHTEIPDVVQKQAEAAFRRISLQEASAQKQVTKKSASKRLRIFLIAAALTALLCTGVFAANRYFGILDFFTLRGIDSEKNISDSIQKEPAQTATENLLADFTVTEALYDGETVYITVEVSAVDSDKYLLVPSDFMEKDPVQHLGIQSTQTIGEYAQSLGKELLYVGCGFDFSEHPAMITYSRDTILRENGTLAFLVTGPGWNSAASTLTCQNTVRTEDARTVNDIIRSEITFPVQPK